MQFNCRKKNLKIFFVKFLKTLKENVYFIILFFINLYMIIYTCKRNILKSISLFSISFFFILSIELFILYTYLYWEYAQPSIQSIINPTQLFFNSKFLQFQQFHPSITLDNAPRILNEIHFLNWNLRKPVLLLENLFSNRRH